MGRWTQYDEDEYRLPEGMKRIGYDADEGRYYFRDSEGKFWVGAEGSEFGEMTRVTSIPSSVQLEDDDDESLEDRRRQDVEASPRATRNGGYEQLPTDHTRPMARMRPSASSSYRTLFPFFLIIAVVLLLIWRLLLSPGLSAAPTKRCPEGTSSHWIQPGESCWELSRKNGWTLDKFREVNPKVVCDPLMPGTSVCLPLEKEKAKMKAAVAAAAQAQKTAKRKAQRRPQ